MPVSAARLRRWVAAVLVLICAIVAGTYFYARQKVQNALKQVPSKIGLEIQQSAQGFTISKSLLGRTLFKVQASKAVQFKQGGRVELHDVTITLYGRDSSRFDQVYGSDFDFDRDSGDVTSKGEVSIDLQANPEGLANPDQTAPKELKNPIHLKTTGLVFNQKTGDAYTPNEVEFRVPQATGTAVGAKYIAEQGRLTLESKLKIDLSGAHAGTIYADHAVLAKAPREIVLAHPRAESTTRKGRADELTLLLREDNTLEHATAVGNVQLASADSPSANVRHDRGSSSATRSEVTSQRLDVAMKAGLAESAIFSGDVHFLGNGTEAVAGRATLGFGSHNVVKTVRADQQVRLLQHQENSASAATQVNVGNGSQSKGAAQDVEVTAPAMDFLVAGGNRLSRADTIGAGVVTIESQSRDAGSTRITAEKFSANFDPLGQLSKVHGGGSVRAVSSAPPVNGVAQPDRVSTSDTIDAQFLPQKGIQNILQQGHFTYTSDTLHIFSNSARYFPDKENVVIEGSPRFVDNGSTTTADQFVVNRTTGQAVAHGNVKTTYSDMKPQPDGSLLAAGDPIHVTAAQMTANNNPPSATYTGKAHLWQNANIIDAPLIRFDKAQRTVAADFSPKQKVSTVLVGTDHNGKTAPVTVTANHLTYRDSERRAHFEGDVVARSSDLTITSNQMDVYLAAAGTQVSSASANAGPARLERIIASGSVHITQPNRHAEGEQLTYTAKDDRFVLTGGPPTLSDSEHGNLTATSLTLFRGDDRVVVEGNQSSPAVTQTRVKRGP